MSIDFDTEGRRSTGGTRPATKKRCAPHVEETLAELKHFAGGDLASGRSSEVEPRQIGLSSKTPKR